MHKVMTASFLEESANLQINSVQFCITSLLGRGDNVSLSIPSRTDPICGEREDH